MRMISTFSLISYSVGVRNLIKERQKYLFRSLLTKNSSSFDLSNFLSKPQDWYIIECITRLWRVIHSYIISPYGAVSHHALACILLRLDDIQRQAVGDIHAFGVIWSECRPQFPANALQSPRFYDILITERRRGYGRKAIYK